MFHLSQSLPCRHYHQHTPSKDVLSQPIFPCFSHSNTKPYTPAFEQSRSLSDFRHKNTTSPLAAGKVHEDNPSKDKLSQSEPPHTSNTNSKIAAPLSKHSQPSSLTHSQKWPTTLSSNSNSKISSPYCDKM